MSTTALAPPPATARWRALGTVAVVAAARPCDLEAAVAVVEAEIDACDRACSRFRADSELLAVATGRRRAVSPWLAEALATALDAARSTEGLVDPTIGQCLVDLGYDRSFEEVDPDSPVVVTASHVPAWQHVHVDPVAGTATVPAAVHLDLGATAKALCADRAAAAAAAATGGGVLVGLGGDLSAAGPSPAGGWPVLVTDRADAEPVPGPGTQVVALHAGGLATSGTAARRWARAGAPHHHLVDPRTGRPAAETWRTASVAAASCVEANTASTAAIILGAAAPGWLAARGVAARLVTPAGDVALVGAWPLDGGGR